MSALAVEVVEQNLRLVGLNHRNAILKQRAVDFMLVAIQSVFVGKAMLLTATERVPKGIDPQLRPALEDAVEDFALALQGAIPANLVGDSRNI